MTSTGSIHRIRRIDLRTGGFAGEQQGVQDGVQDYRTALPRADFDVEAAVPAVQAICEAVRTRGVEAIHEYSQRFDGVVVEDLRVPPHTITEALERLDPDIRAGLEESI